MAIKLIAGYACRKNESGTFSNPSTQWISVPNPEEVSGERYDHPDI